MIGKIPKAGRGFKGLVSYLTNSQTSARSNPDRSRVLWSDTANLLTTNPQKAVTVMRATANKSRRCKSPVYHFVISWTPEEKPSAALTRRIVADTCADLGLSDHQRIVIAHDDTRHAHVHVVVNRVHPDTGKAWNRAQDWVRLERSLARQAKAHALRFVPGRHNADGPLKPEHRKAPDPEYQRARRTGQPLPPQKWDKARIAAERPRILALFKAARTWEELDNGLAAQGWRLEGKGQGHVMRDDKSEVKLSQVSKDIRIKRLEEQFNAPWCGAIGATHPKTPPAGKKPHTFLAQTPRQFGQKPRASDAIPTHPQLIACTKAQPAQSKVDLLNDVGDHNPSKMHSSPSKPAPLSPRRKRKGPKL